MVIEGAVVVINGATTGIGRATALTFASRGANLILAGRRDDVLESLVQQCRGSGGEAIAVPVDVSEPRCR